MIEHGSISSNSTTPLNLQATCQVNPQTRIRFDVFNLFNDIAYDNTSRRPGEPPEGMNDPSFSLRTAARCV
jgi:hypothetical protein